jgi:small subunit ribosomal protein S4
MGRYIGPVCRLCRREGSKLFLKGERCYNIKCPLDQSDKNKKKRNSPPGMHNWKRSKLTEYGQRLREKQKVKRFYGVFENQFKKYFREAERMPGNTGENLLVLLERRLDNVVWRAGFAMSHAQARQFIGHGHIRINGKKVDLPSYLVKTGDVITIVEKDALKKVIGDIYQNYQHASVPSWIERMKDKPEAKVMSTPARNEITLINMKEQLIVEFCSR